MNAKEKVLSKFLKNLIFFGRFILPNMATKPSPQMHYDIAKLLMNKKLRKICIKAPRGFGKSSIVACVFILWHLMFEEGVKYVIIQSKTEGEAIKRLRTIQNVLEYSEIFTKIFGYWGQHSAKKWSETRIILKDGSIIEAKGVTQQVRGVKEDHQRPTLLILDDPEDENNTKTPTAMNANFDNLLAAIPSLDPHIGRVIVIGTPIHQRCIVERLQEIEGWTYRHFEALDENDKSNWEEQFSTQYLHEERASLQSANRMSKWYSEYMCQVTGDEDQLFKYEYLRFYKAA